jgi:hypothetical protein
MNRASLMIVMNHPTDAIAILEKALKMAKPEDVSEIQKRLDSARRSVANQEEREPD